MKAGLPRFLFLSTILSSSLTVQEMKEAKPTANEQ